MSHLLETLGRGLLTRLVDVFDQQLGFVEETQDQLELRIQSCPTSVDAHCQAGVHYLRSEQVGPAQSAFKAALLLDDNALTAQIGLACVHDELGNLRAAADMLQVACQQDDQDPALTFGVAFCYERLRDTCTAAEWYRRALRQCHTLRNAHERLAAIAIRQGNWQDASDCYQQLAELDPDDLDVHLLLGAIELHRGEAKRAVDIFQQALLIEPQVEATSTWDDVTLTDPAEIQQATCRAEALVEEHPTTSEFRVQLGDLYAKLGDDAMAVDQYRIAVDLEPTYLEAVVKLGTQYLRRGELADAATAFHNASELNDRLVLAFVGLGVAQDAAGLPQDAAATLDLAVGLAPNSILLASQCVRLRMRAELDDEDGGDAHNSLLTAAAQRLGHMTTMRDCDAALYFRHGLVLRNLCEDTAARRSFARAVALHPEFARASMHLGVTLCEDGLFDVGCHHFRRAFELPDSWIAPHYDLALLFAQRSRFDLLMERMHNEAGPFEADSQEASLLLSLQNVGLLDRAAAGWRDLDALVDDPEPASDRLPQP